MRNLQLVNDYSLEYAGRCHNEPGTMDLSEGLSGAVRRANDVRY